MAPYIACLCGTREFLDWETKHALCSSLVKAAGKGDVGKGRGREVSNAR